MAKVYNGRAYHDPVKRAAKRAAQRAAGYQGVKKKTPSAVMEHNSGRDTGGRADGRERQFMAEGARHATPETTSDH